MPLPVTHVCVGLRLLDVAVSNVNVHHYRMHVLRHHYRSLGEISYLSHMATEKHLNTMVKLNVGYQLSRNQDKVGKIKAEIRREAHYRSQICFFKSNKRNVNIWMPTFISLIVNIWQLLGFNLTYLAYPKLCQYLFATMLILYICSIIWVESSWHSCDVWKHQRERKDRETNRRGVWKTPATKTTKTRI